MNMRDLKNKTKTNLEKKQSKKEKERSVYCIEKKACDIKHANQTNMRKQRCIFQPIFFVWKL